MPRFVAPKRLTLEFLGDEWKDCFVDITPVTPNGLREILVEAALTPEGETKEAKSKRIREQEIARFRSAFVRGAAFDYDSGAVVDITRDQLADLPNEVSEKLADVYMGTVDPKSPTPSNDSSSTTAPANQ